MGFFKKLFTGIGFAAGFLFFGCLSVIVYASRGRHKPCHRRSSFWNTLERYLDVYKRQVYWMAILGRI